MRLYFFGDGHADGSGALRPLLGAKGAELAEMARLGIPVPAGFTLSTELCAQLRSEGWTPEHEANLRRGLDQLEAMTGDRFDDPERPLLLSVRAGAPRPLPGCLATVLNIGVHEGVVDGLARRYEAPRFAWEILVRAQEDFGELVQNIDPFYFEEVLDDARRAFGIHPGEPLHEEALREAHRRFRDMRAPNGLPEGIADPWEQLKSSILAAIASLDAPATRARRERRGDADKDAVAISIQQMVFGSADERSGTGVLWTRDRRTGRPGIDGDFLFQAQGEDVTGRSVPSLPIIGEDSLTTRMPEISRELHRVARMLENHYRDMQQIEFTVERGRLWVLQTREARRTFEATLQVAVDLVDEGLITKADAIARVDPERVRTLLHPTIERSRDTVAIGTGIATSPGAASGLAVFSAQDAERFAAELNMAVILLKTDTTPDDIRALQSARGVITSRGGLTSHAAVVTRQMGKPSIVSCNALFIDPLSRSATIGGHTIRQGDTLTMDGATGEVFVGQLPLRPPVLPDAWHSLIAWADEARTLGIRANADFAGDARLARRFGAEGIGLVRTEHMFFDPERIERMREVILAQTAAQRADALAALKPLQVQDFFSLIEAVEGDPVTIRLLDPPLHEFLPQRLEDLEALGARLGMNANEVERYVSSLREQNPMLGHRGCRLAISWPEIYDMQAEAVFEAMAEASARGIPHRVELLVPLVSDPEEFRRVRDRIHEVYAPWAQIHGMPEKPRIGSMIEVARACLLADEIAVLADFISFGTNDLTQSVYGLSRDDASSFLPAYLAAGIMADNPFSVLDLRGVGRFIEMAVKKARAANPQIGIGVCGEQGSDPRSVAWLQNGVVDYVSCSPYRVPIARFAAGRAIAAHIGPNPHRS